MSLDTDYRQALIIKDQQAKEAKMYRDRLDLIERERHELADKFVVMKADYKALAQKYDSEVRTLVEHFFLLKSYYFYLCFQILYCWIFCYHVLLLKEKRAFGFRNRLIFFMDVQIKQVHVEIKCFCTENFHERLNAFAKSRYF